MLPRLIVALSLAALPLGSLPLGSASADPILTAVRLAPQDTGGGGTGVVPVQPPSGPPSEPMLADVAGPARPIGLADLLQLAVRQAPALAQAQIDIEIAEAEIEASRAWADWAVGAQLSAQTRSAAGGGYSRVDTISLSGDVTKMISTGGTLGLHAEGGLQRQTGGDFPAINQLGEVVTVRFNQPLLRGRGRAQLEASERIARHSRDAAEIAHRAAAIALVREVVLGYLDLVDAEKQLAIRRASLELAKERLRVTEAGIDKGGVARAETIPVEQAIATREGEVLGGEMTILQQSLALRRQVALPSAPGDMVLASTVELAIPSRTWNQTEIVAAAEAYSPELARLASMEKGATISIEVTENGLLPQLDLGLAVGPSFLQDLGSTDTKADNDYSVGISAGATLTYRQTLGQTATNAFVRRARAQRHSIQVTATDVRNQIVEAAAVAVANIQVAERRYALAVRAVALAEQNLAVEQARLGLGKSRNVDVLERQDELRAAQLQVQQTITAWHRSAAVIAALTGEILPQYGITLDSP